MTKEAHFSSEFKETALFAPPALLARLEQLDKGPKNRGALAEEIARLSEAYTRDRGELGAASSAPGGLRARLRFFLPRDLPKAGKPLLEAASRGLLPSGARLRVLDLGAGLGTTSLSLLRALHLLGDEREVEIMAIDQDPGALEHARALLSEKIEGFAAPSKIRIEAGDLLESLKRDPVQGERFDLILIGLALNELRDREGLIKVLMNRLSDGGLILIIEPALREESRALMRLRDAIARGDELEILGPCFHRAPCPLLERKRDWCHDSLSGEHPEAIAALAEAAGLRASRPTFSWLLLRRSARGGEAAADQPEALSGEQSDRARGRIVSHHLASKGKLEFQLCDERGELITLRRLDRSRSKDDTRFDELGRGARVELSGESKKHALLIDKTSEIKRI